MENNTIFVGSKPVMNYVLAVVTQFNEGSNSVTLRARGKAISRAVDAAEIVRNRFVPESDVTDIQISTEEIENYNHEKTNVFNQISLEHFFQINILKDKYLMFLFHEPLHNFFLLPLEHHLYPFHNLLNYSNRRQI